MAIYCMHTRTYVYGIIYVENLLVDRDQLAELS